MSAATDPSRRARLVTIAIAALIAGPFMLARLTQENRNAVHRFMLQVDKAALDFGEQPPIDAFAWTLPLTNKTDRPLEVLDFDLGCLCTRVTPNTFTILPDERREVEVVVDLQPKNDDDLTRTVREFAASIRPIFKGSGLSQQEWQLTGRVVNPYVLNPPYVNYGDSLVSGMPFPPREILVSAPQGIRELIATCDPSFGDILVSNTPNADNSFTLKFTPRGTLPIGRHEFALHIHGINAAGLEMAPTRLRVFAEVFSDVEVCPSVVHLGALTVGEEATTNVSIRSRSSRPFELTDIDMGSVQTLRIVETLEESDQRHYELRYRATDVGARAFKLRFDVKSHEFSAEHQPERITLIVCYTGLENPVAREIHEPPVTAKN